MRWTILLAILSLVSPALARDFRCAVVDMTTLFNQYPGTARAKDKLADWEKKKGEDLKDLYQDLNDLNQEMNDTGSKLSTKMKAKKQKELEDKYADYKQRETQYKNEALDKENEMRQVLIDEIKPIIAEVAKSKDVDLVLDSSNVVYNSSPLDLTKDVLDRFKGMTGSADTKK